MSLSYHPIETFGNKDSEICFPCHAFITGSSDLILSQRIGDTQFHLIQVSYSAYLQILVCTLRFKQKGPSMNAGTDAKLYLETELLCEYSDM